jgi:RNA polymerase sigma factor (sigma-70 family)
MAITALSDAELLDAARNGDEAAFTELYVRHHAAARRLAGSYTRGGDADDLVNGAFERVLGALRRGGGPSESFRAYLFVTLRRLAGESARRGSDEPLDDVPEPVLAASGGPELEGAEREMVSEAFESLPGRWQAVLWHTAVEGRQPREIAGVVGLSANAAAALAYRARERLRQAYLQAHLQTTPRPRCEPHRSRLGGYVRDGLSRRDHTATAQHVEDCESCRSLVTELNDVNRMLVRSVAPLFLLASGGKLAGSLTAAGSGVAGASAAASAASAAASAASAAASAASAASSPAGAGSLLGGAWSSIRRAGTAVGGAAAATAAAVTLTVATIPHDGGPSNRPDASWVAGAAPSSQTVDDVDVTESEPAVPQPAESEPGPSSPAAPSTGTSPSTTEAAGPVVDAEAGLDVQVGDGNVEVGADVQVGLDLNWVRDLLGSGTLEVLVPNNGAEPVEGLEVDVQLSTSARATTLRSDGDCRGTSGSVLGVILDLVSSLTCGLGAIDPGATAATRLDLRVTAEQQNARVIVRLHGDVVAQDLIALPV